MLWHKTRWPEVGDQTRLSWHQAAKPGRPARRQQIPLVPDTRTKTERVKASSQRKHSDNEFKQNRSNTMPDNLIALVTVAAELNQDPNLVAARIAEHVVIDPSSGLRCVPADVCRWLIDQAARAIAASHQRDQAHRASLATQFDPTRERIKALKERAEQFHRAGHSDMSAFEMMAAGDTQAHLDGVPSFRMDKLLRGESYGARFTPTKES